MNYYMAPLEGITTYIFRRNYNKYFHTFDKYFIPFISNTNIGMKEIMELSRESNEGMNTVPQILSKTPEHFLKLAEIIAEFGYDTVNLNLGCPSKTVVTKKRGAGMLYDTDMLDRFLYEIFDKCPLKISIKTRIGISDDYEWEEILDVYKKYSIEELIIHPRFQKEFYSGKVHLDAYIAATKALDIKLCYNGDIISRNALDNIINTCPSIDTVMLGRGILRNPGMLNELTESSPVSKDTIISFHDAVYNEYKERFSGEVPVVSKMLELWTYMKDSFTNSDNYVKKLFKAKHCSEYEMIVNSIFRNEDYIHN